MSVIKSFESLRDAQEPKDLDYVVVGQRAGERGKFTAKRMTVENFLKKVIAGHTSTFVSLSDTDPIALSNGYVKWNAGGTQLVYSATIPYSDLTGTPAAQDLEATLAVGANTGAHTIVVDNFQQIHFGNSSNAIRYESAASPIEVYGSTKGVKLNAGSNGELLLTNVANSPFSLISGTNEMLWATTNNAWQAKDVSGNDGILRFTNGLTATRNWDLPDATGTIALTSDIPTVLNDLTDVTITTAAQGDVLFRNATGWVNLGAGTNGQVLTSGGAAADVSWTTLAGADGNGIYDGSGTVPTTTVSTLTDTWNITGGNVGIGVAPTNKFQVAGSTRFNGTHTQLGGDIILNGTGAGSLVIGAAAPLLTPQMIEVHTTGNTVGSPDVDGSSMFLNARTTSSTNNIYLGQNYQGDGGSLANFGVNITNHVSDLADFYWRTGTGLGTEKMRLTSDGNLLIGLSSSSEKLHVNGNTQTDGKFTSDGAPLSHISADVHTFRGTTTTQRGLAWFGSTTGTTSLSVATDGAIGIGKDANSLVNIYAKLSGVTSNFFQVHDSTDTTMLARAVTDNESGSGELKWGIGNASATGLNSGTTNWQASAMLNIDGSAAAYGSLRIRAGVAPTGNALSDGVIWHEADALYFRSNGTTYNLTDIGAGADGNGIYDGSGSLSADTTVTQGTNQMIFDATPTVNNQPIFTIKSNSTTATRSLLKIDNGANNLLEFVTTASDPTLLIKSQAGVNEHAFASNGSSFVCRTSGNFGVGINIASEKLHVNGNTQHDGKVAINQAVSVANNLLQIGGTANGGAVIIGSYAAAGVYVQNTGAGNAITVAANGGNIESSVGSKLRITDVAVTSFIGRLAVGQDVTVSDPNKFVVSNGDSVFSGSNVTISNASLTINTVTPSVIGQVWTATGTAGQGAWQAAAGGADGNGIFDIANKLDSLPPDMQIKYDATTPLFAIGHTQAGTFALNYTGGTGMDMTKALDVNGDVFSKGTYTLNRTFTSSSGINSAIIIDIDGSSPAATDGVSIDFIRTTGALKLGRINTEFKDLVLSAGGTSFVEGLRLLETSGNVAIGGASGATPLHVNGNTQLDGNLNVDSNLFYVDATANTVGVGRINALTNTPFEVYGGGGSSSLYAQLTHVGGGSGSTETGLKIEGSSNNKTYNLIVTNSAASVNRGQETFSIIDNGATTNAVATFMGGGLNNIGIGGGTFPTGMTNGIVLRNGVAPTSQPVDRAMMWAQNIVAGNSAPHFMTENGDIVKLFQGAAVADATGTATGTDATIITNLQEQLNTALARLRAHGLIAT